MAAARPAAAPAGEFPEEEEALRRLHSAFVGRRVLLDGRGGSVEDVEAHLEHGPLFSIRFDDRNYGGQLDQDELDAAMAAAQQVRLQPRVAANAAQH